MFQIDLSFLKGGIVSENDLKKAELEYDSKYKSKILNDILSCNHSNSSCESCGNEENINTPLDKRIIVEADCKGLLGYHFCELPGEIIDEINNDDMLIVKCEDSLEISRVVETGDIVSLRRQKLGFCNEELPKATRKATEEDLDQYRRNLKDEATAVGIFKEKVIKFNLNMKLVHIHYQFDRKKLYFFYTADGRVDFRELAKELAGIYKTRIELRQIGVRDEAKQVGGMGTCGREYCCTAFLNNFRRITTQLANEQNLSSNMAKLSGPCGKLKCCLSFEATEEEVEKIIQQEGKME